MKLDFKYIEKALLDYNAKSELKQAAIIMVRNIFKEAETKQCDIPVVSSSFIRPMTKACKVCIYYDKQTYPMNETCLSCSLFKDGKRLKNIERYREQIK